MPWKECDPMSERMKFVARALDGERMTDLCLEFGISRKSGYKFVERYRAEGVSAFIDQSRRPHRCPHRTPGAIVNLITEVREKHPSWGAPKIRDYLSKKHPSAKVPASSTIHVILERHQLIKRRGRSRHRIPPAQGTALSKPRAPNELWCADFKGQFRMGNGHYCYPLTVTDQFSRFVLCVDAQESTKELGAMLAFERTFQAHGLPHAIRTDNGVPFSSQGLFGLSKLSIWWLRLGIRIERIQPGRPEQNGAHERMHLTLKQTTASPPSKNMLQQQESFDSFVEMFNHERPHDGIGKKCPGELYQKSPREMPLQLSELEYPAHDRTLRVSRCGALTLEKRRRVYLATVFAGQNLGLKRLEEEGLWRVTFMNYNLGCFDEESLKFSPQEDPFQTEEEMKATSRSKKVSPMSPE
jgi:transposase InsO family protein